MKMTPTDKPYEERSIDFVVLNKQQLDSRFLSFRAVPGLDTTQYFINLCNEMINSIQQNNRPSKESMTYQEMYEIFQQPITYDTLKKLESQHALEYLKKFKEELLRIQATKATTSSFDFSLFEELVLYYSYAEFFRDVWYMQPRIGFSFEFYDLYSKETREMLLNHFQYDNAEPEHPYHLPVLLLTSYTEQEKADFFLPPHSIPAEKARVLLAEVQNKKNKKNLTPALQKQYDLWTKMLQLVIEQDAVLQINTYP